LVGSQIFAITEIVPSPKVPSRVAHHPKEIVFSHFNIWISFLFVCVICFIFVAMFGRYLKREKLKEWPEVKASQGEIDLHLDLFPLTALPTDPVDMYQ